MTQTKRKETQQVILHYLPHDHKQRQNGNLDICILQIAAYHFTHYGFMFLKLSLYYFSSSYYK